MLSFPNAKDPNSELDYIIDWSEWLSGDTIAASTMTLETGITSTGDDFNDTVTTVWLDGGVSGKSYDVTNKITTASGRVAERTIKLKVKEK